MTRTPFFVGYLNDVPKPLAMFCLGAGALLVGGFAFFAFLLAAAADNPGSGTFGDEVTMKGTIQAAPYPFLVLPADAAHPGGHGVLLAGEGKIGVEAMAGPLAGRTAQVHGVLVKRGDLDMIVVNSDDGLQAAENAAASSITQVPEGRWRVTGEICDGKCYAGAMHPGTGLAHKACASLCISGGVPPVFVSAAPVGNTIFLLLADRDGGPAPARMQDFIGLPVTLEGDIRHVGDLSVLRADWTTAKSP